MLPKNQPSRTRSMNQLQILFLAAGAAILPAGSGFAESPDDFGIRSFRTDRGRGVRSCDEFRRFPRIGISRGRCDVGLRRRFVDRRCDRFDDVRTPDCDFYGNRRPGQVGRRTPDSVFRREPPLPNRQIAPNPNARNRNNTGRKQLLPPNSKPGNSQSDLPPVPGLVPPNRERGNVNPRGN